MEFRILGPLELVDGGAVVSVPTGRERTLLLDLLVHRNDVVSVDTLIDDLWEGTAPATATKVVQNGVSRLRRDCVGDRLETRSPGYLLRVEAGELDVERARALVKRAEDEPPRQAAETLREALGLWRGQPLADVAYAAFAQGEIRRLEELRLTLAERMFDVELDAGGERELVGELESHVAAHPLRERPRGQLMLALYRTGRQAEALESYREGRRMLVEELGIEPGPELQELHRRILEQDATLGGKPARTRRRRRGLAGAAVAAGVLAVALGAWLALGGDGTAATPIVANSVAALDPAAGRTTDSFAVGATPRAVAVDRNAIWTANFQDRTVTRLARSGGGSTTVGTGAPATALATGAGAAWALSAFDGNLSRLDPQTGRVTAIVPAGSDPTALAAGSAVFVTSQRHGTLARVDPGTLRRSVLRRDLAGPAGVVADGDVVWVAESFKQRLIELDGRTGRTLRTLDISLSPDSLALGAGALWAANPAENDVTRVDLRTGLFRVITVGSDPFALAASDRYVWVANNLDHSVSELDASTGGVIRTIVLTHGFPTARPGKPPPRELTPGGIAVDPDGAAWLTVQRF